MLSKKLHDLTDDELMEQIAKNKLNAFEVLFERHSGKVLGYSQRLMGERSLAEDLSQDVWMKVIKASSSYQTKGQFIAWLFTIIRHSGLNSLKKKKDWDEIDSQHEKEIAAEGIDFTVLLEREESLNQLKELFDKLPAQQRAALTLHLSDEMNYEEIAAELSTSVSAVKSLLFRARKTLLSLREELS